MSSTSFVTAISAVALIGASTAPVSAVQAARRDSTNLPSVPVLVTNNNLLDMRIYVVVGSSTHKIGTVGSFSEMQLELPPFLVTGPDEVQLLARPIGSTTRYLSPFLIFNPGDVIELRIETAINQSRAVVFPRT